MRFEHALLRNRSVTSSLIETLILSTIGFGICYWINPNNIFFLNLTFPFMLFMPVLISLLYGLSYGITSHLLMLLSGIAIQSPFVWTFQFSLYLFASSILILICGQFGSYWRHRMMHIEQLNKYLRERIDHISRAYYFTKISHDIIEEQFISKPASLRSTFVSIKEMLAKDNGKFTKQLMQRVLEAITQYVQIEKAQLHLVNEKNKIEPTPFAFIGGEPISDVEKDPLVTITMKNKLTNYVAVNEFDDEFSSKFLVTVPIISSKSVIFGYLLIDQISFHSLNNESLQKLMILLSYLANIKDAYKKSHMILKEYPNCPLSFAQEISNLSYLKNQYNIQSIFVTADIPKSHKKAPFFLENFHALKRNLDVVWVYEDGDRYLFITLMPLSHSIAIFGYITRIKKFFLETFEIDISKEGIRFFYLEMLKMDVLSTINTLINKNTSEVKIDQSIPVN